MDELQGCERCREERPIESMTMMDDCWFCAECVADFDKTFAACDHAWKPHTDSMGDVGRYCTRCTGFVRDEDMHLLKS
jgi:hypothetical protein